MCDTRPLTQGRETAYITTNGQLGEWGVASGKHSATPDRHTSKTSKDCPYLTDVWAMLCAEPGSIPQIVAHRLRAKQTQSKSCAVGIDTCNRVVFMQVVAGTPCGGASEACAERSALPGPSARGLPGQDRTHFHRSHPGTIRLREAETCLTIFSQDGG